MKIQHALGVSFAVGLLLGSGAIFGLHAAAVPPAFVVVEVNEITDQQAFKEGYGKWVRPRSPRRSSPMAVTLREQGLSPLSMEKRRSFSSSFLPEPRQSKSLQCQHERTDGDPS
jgi:hypothetical protein